MVAIRNAQGISQEQLAFKIGCHPSLVHKWEQHKRVPSGFMFSCWADALGAQIKIQ
jgi:DNA-binding transcriptional regulator YiaG